MGSHSSSGTPESSPYRRMGSSSASVTRESSPFRRMDSNSSSGTYRRGSNSSSGTNSPTSVKEANQNSDGVDGMMKYISKEAANVASANNALDASDNKLYGGSKIPSRLFQHLQSEFSSDSSQSNSTTTTPVPEILSVSTEDKPHLSPGLLKLLQSDYNKLQNDRRTSSPSESCLSSSYGEMEEYYNNGIVADTAATKESVLKELVNQFDPTCTLKRKPKAAPGRVFRYLQQTYDDQDDSVDSRNVLSSSRRSSPNSLDRGCNNNKGTVTASVILDNDSLLKPDDDKDSRSAHRSPTFNYLRNQYKNNEMNDKNENGLKKVVSRDLKKYSTNYEDEHDRHNLNSLQMSEDGEPIQNKAYIGKRIPGRTFKMLQENYDTHPSVMQARK